MTTLHSSHERARLRRELVQLASFLLLTLLICGLVSLFSLWSMERLYAANEARQATVLQALNSARSAQVAFKIQVQTWKNVLLRGEDPGEYALARQEFELAEAQTDDNLKAATDWASTLGDGSLRQSINTLLAAHLQIGRSYRAAMPDSANIRAQRTQADAAVRGIDRTLNARFDALVTAIVAKNVHENYARRTEENYRFYVLSRAIWISIGLSFSLVLFLLWLMLQDRVLRK